MCATAQGSGGKGGGNVHRIQRDGLFARGLSDNNSATVMKIILPAGIRIFRAMNKRITDRKIRADGHHSHMRAVFCLIKDFRLTGFDIHALNG
ncbi:hypothetical protein SRABI106_03647 [Rahnella aquatilis]|nr:hypothetical protein SRABI106_03647 [Rahnella aquatilis]